MASSTLQWLSRQFFINFSNNVSIHIMAKPRWKIDKELLLRKILYINCSCWYISSAGVMRIYYKSKSIQEYQRKQPVPVPSGTVVKFGFPFLYLLKNILFFNQKSSHTTYIYRKSRNKHDGNVYLCFKLLTRKQNRLQGLQIVCFIILLLRNCPN